MQETQKTQVWSLGQEDPLEKEMATHSSILAWKIPDQGAWQAIVHRVAKEPDAAEHACTRKNTFCFSFPSFFSYMHIVELDGHEMQHSWTQIVKIMNLFYK